MSITTNTIRSIAALAAAAAIVPAAASAAPPKPARGAAPGVLVKQASHSRALAHAASASNASVDSFTASGACDLYQHENAFSASVMLNSRRFPSGAYIVLRYAFQRAGSTGWRTTNWYGPTLISNLVSNPDPDVTIFAPQSLRQVSFNITSGHFIGWAQIGVWNGSAYEYTSTLGDYYSNIGRFGLGFGHANSCWVSI